jgi:hypothetical protein
MTQNEQGQIDSQFSGFRGAAPAQSGLKYMVISHFFSYNFFLAGFTRIYPDLVWFFGLLGRLGRRDFDRHRKSRQVLESGRASGACRRGFRKRNWRSAV